MPPVAEIPPSLSDSDKANIAKFLTGGHAMLFATVLSQVIQNDQYPCRQVLLTAGTY